MSGAEIQTPAAGEQLVIDARGRGIRIFVRCSESIGERDIDLHRPARANGIPACEQRAAERHRAGEVLEDVAELFFRPRMLDTVAVTAAGRRVELQHLVDQAHGNARMLGASVDFAPRNTAEVGNHGVDSKSRFLRRHGRHRTDILARRLEGERRECILDILHPPAAVHDALRQGSIDGGAGFVGIDAGRRRPRRTARQRQRKGRGEDTGPWVFNETHSLSRTPARPTSGWPGPYTPLLYDRNPMCRLCYKYLELCITIT